MEKSGDRTVDRFSPISRGNHRIYKSMQWYRTGNQNQDDLQYQVLWREVLTDRGSEIRWSEPHHRPHLGTEFSSHVQFITADGRRPCV